MKKSNFLEGAFIATAAIIFTKILGIIYVIPFYSIIGEQGGALYGYSYTIYNFFLTISTIGFPLAISKLTSEYNTLKLYNEKIRLYKLSKRCILVFSILCFLICFIFAPQIASLIIGNIENGNTIQDVSFTIRMVSFALLVVPLLSIMRGYLQGHKYIKEPSISQVIEQVVRVVIILSGSYLTLKVFNLSLRTAIGVSVFASCIGGLSAYLYLLNVTRKNKDKLKPKEINESKITNKEIIKKIIAYSIPFIVISCANQIYSSTDMILMLRTLPKLDYIGKDVETISSVFTTWGPKINSIVIAIANGLIISLIPHIVSLYVEKDNDGVNKIFNKCLKIVLLIIVPIAIFISINATSIWTIFYGKSKYGPLIIKCNILLTIIDSLYIIVNSLLQSLSKYKILFTSVISGIVINLVLDIPLMYVFNILHSEAFYGAILATFLGLITSLIISFKSLKKELNFNYTETLNLLPKVILRILVLIIIDKLISLILPINSPRRIIQIFNIIILGITTVPIYIRLNKNYLSLILPDKIVKILRKIKLV